MTTRRRFTAEFKAKVALEAIRGERTISELATKHQLHPNQITQWKRQAIDKLAEVFDDKASDAQISREAEVTKLHAKIGQSSLEVEGRVANTPPQGDHKCKIPVQIGLISGSGSAPPSSRQPR